MKNFTKKYTKPALKHIQEEMLLVWIGEQYQKSGKMPSKEQDTMDQLKPKFTYSKTKRLINMITYKKQPFGQYLIEEVGNPENNRLVQVDMEFPTLAQAFGGAIHWDDIEGAIRFLDKNEGKEAEDPGYL